MNIVFNAQLFYLNILLKSEGLLILNMTVNMSSYITSLFLQKSLRSNLPRQRQRLNGQMKNRILKRGIASSTLSVGPGGRLKRGNGLRNNGT